jgi:hypothetical protein
MGPTYHINVMVNEKGAAMVLWLSAGGRQGECRRSFASQEEAEYFAAGVQAGIISMGGSATVEIVTVGRTWADATQREMTEAARDLGVPGADYPRTFADLQADLERVDPQGSWFKRV